MDKIDILRKYPNCKVKYILPNCEEYGFTSWGHNIDISTTTNQVLITAGETTAFHLIDEDIKLPIESITPMLRPMNAMPEDETEVYYELRRKCREYSGGSVHIKILAELVDWCRDRNYDIDGLIESKQAEAEQ